MDHIEPAAAGADRGPWPNSEFQETGASMARLIPKTPEDRLWPWRSRPGAPAAVCQRFRPTASLSPQVATPLPLPTAPNFLPNQLGAGCAQPRSVFRSE